MLHDPQTNSQCFARAKNLAVLYQENSLMIPKSFEESIMGGPTCACIGHVMICTIDVGCLKHVVNVMLVWQNR